MAFNNHTVIPILFPWLIAIENKILLIVNIKKVDFEINPMVYFKINYKKEKN